jgi:hypothetical protein
MFKKPFLHNVPPCGDTDDPHEETIATPVPWNLFPRHALHQKQGRAPKARGPHICPHPLRPHVPASERLFFWISSASIAKRRKLAHNFSIQHLLTYDNALVASLAESTRSLYGSAIIDWIQWCDRLNIPEFRRLPISTDDLNMFIAHKVGVEGTSKTTNTLAGLRAWHTIQDVPWPENNPLAPCRNFRSSTLHT